MGGIFNNDFIAWAYLLISLKMADFVVYYLRFSAEAHYSLVFDYAIR